MRSNVCIPKRENGQADFLFEAILGQCRLLAARAEGGFSLDQRSLENLSRASREFAETEKKARD